MTKRETPYKEEEQKGNPIELMIKGCKKIKTCKKPSSEMIPCKLWTIDIETIDELSRPVTLDDIPVKYRNITDIIVD